jgi:hypothetical protein|tara:strand:+ start:685 stop:903 length:219 start_codon:yes stop_codon:yes gene_type:complete
LKVTIELRAELLKLKGLEIRVPPSFEELRASLFNKREVLSINKSSTEDKGEVEVLNQLKSSKLALKALIVLR